MTRLEKCRRLNFNYDLAVVDEMSFYWYYYCFYGFKRDYWLVIDSWALSSWLLERQSLPWTLLIQSVISCFNAPLFLPVKFLSFFLEIELWIIASYVFFDLL